VVAFRALMIRPLQTGLTRHRFCAEAQPCQSTDAQHKGGASCIDRSKFFDRVNHDRLMSRLATRIKDKRVLKLIRAFVNSGIQLENNEITYPGEGTPQWESDQFG
jgi:retron-type reverse transcriptase